MRANKLLIIMVIVCTAVCCATEKEQRIPDATKATSANANSTTSNENVAQPDALVTQDSNGLSYEPAVVELRGRLITKMYYGPPNYGENPKTDSKEVLPFLILSKPVNVHGNPDPDAGPDQISVEDVRKMGLVLTLPHKTLIGKDVIVKGALFHGFTGHHHTDVLMRVQSIRLAAPERASF